MNTNFAFKKTFQFNQVKSRMTTFSSSKESKLNLELSKRGSEATNSCGLYEYYKSKSENLKSRILNLNFA